MNCVYRPNNRSLIFWLWCKRRHWERRDVARFWLGDFADALFRYLIDPDNRVHRNVAAVYALELGFQFLLARINHELRALTKNHFLNLDETIQIALVDLARIYLEYLSLIEEDDFKNGCVGHKF